MTEVEQEDAHTLYMQLQIYHYALTGRIRHFCFRSNEKHGQIDINKIKTFAV